MTLEDHFDTVKRADRVYVPDETSLKEEPVPTPEALKQLQADVKEATGENITFEQMMKFVRRAAFAGMLAITPAVALAGEEPTKIEWISPDAANSMLKAKQAGAYVDFDYDPGKVQIHRPDAVGGVKDLDLGDIAQKVIITQNPQLDLSKVNVIKVENRPHGSAFAGASSGLRYMVVYYTMKE